MSPSLYNVFNYPQVRKYDDTAKILPKMAQKKPPLQGLNYIPKTPPRLLVTHHIIYLLLPYILSLEKMVILLK